MKNIFLLSALLLVFASCTKDQDTILESPDKRLNSLLAEYQAQLVDPELGWIGYLLTGTEKVHVFNMSFNKDNRVVMTSDYAKAAAESSYIVRALQKPTLIFDTYSTIHIINDPTSSISGGALGKGQVTDFEFQFIKASKDTIELEGVLNKSKFFLIRAKNQTELDNSYNNTSQEIAKAYSDIQTYFKRVNIGGIECEVNLNTANKRFTLKYLEGEDLITKNVNYFSVGNRLRFFESIKLGNQEIAGLSDFNYDATKAALVSTSFDGKEFLIKEETKPLKYEIGAAKAWYNWAKAISYASAYSPFQVDGSADGLGLLSLGGYRRLDFAPATTAGASDFARIFATTNYGVGLKTTIDDNGIAVFSFMEDRGTIPAAARTVYDNYVKQYTQPQGYYIIMTNNSTRNAEKVFDMVSVSDAKDWVTWAY